MLKKVYIFSFVFFLLLTLSNQVSAQSEAKATRTNTANKPEKKKEESIEKTLLQRNMQISAWLDQAADKIDLWLVGKRVTKQKNQTNLKIQNSTFSTEGKQITNAFSISLNPRFPNLEEYLQLKFTSTDDRTEERQAVSNNLAERQKEKNYNVGVGLVKDIGKIKTSFQPTVQVRDRVTLSHSLIFDAAIERRRSVINPKLELFANADKGVGFYNALNFHYQLSPKYGLTLINEAEYLERLNTYTVSNGPALSHAYSDTVMLEYSLIFTSNNRPSYHLESYTVAFSYGLQIYKRILDIQAIPQLDFQKERRFKGAAGITFNVNLRF